MTEQEIKEVEKKRQNLQMLVGNVPDDEDELEFKGDKSDPRFSKLINQNKEFALDPTHKSFQKQANPNLKRHKKW